VRRRTDSEGRSRTRQDPERGSSLIGGEKQLQKRENKNALCSHREKKGRSLWEQRAGRKTLQKNPAEEKRGKRFFGTNLDRPRKPVSQHWGEDPY